MNIRAGLREYILQTHNTNFFWRFNGGGGLNPPNPPSGYATERVSYLRYARSMYCCYEYEYGSDEYEYEYQVLHLW